MILRQDSLQLLRGSTVSTIPPILHVHFLLHATLTTQTNGRNLGNFKKQCCLGNRVTLSRKVFFFSSHTTNFFSGCKGLILVMLISISLKYPSNKISVEDFAMGLLHKTSRRTQSLVRGFFFETLCSVVNYLYLLTFRVSHRLMLQDFIQMFACAHVTLPRLSDRSWK